MNFATFRSYYDAMSSSDAQVLAISFVCTTAIGGAIIAVLVWLLQKYQNRKTPQRQQKRSLPESMQRKQAIKEVVKERRHIPAGAQAALMTRAQRQVAEGDHEKGLITYLSLLYAAVESKDENALPEKLTECLRGAAECYRRLGQTENAVKFLQAERRIFEEIVANAANVKKDKAGSRTSVLQALLNPKNQQDDLPHRCSVLTEVAESCARLGRHDVALAYHVKAAAMRQKITGKQLDEHSQEFVAIAESLAHVQQSGGKELAEKAVTAATTGENAVAEDSAVMKLVRERVEKKMM